MNIACVLALVVCCLIWGPVNGQDKCSPEKLKDCMGKLSRYRDPEFPIPKTEDEVAASCNVIKNGSRCVRSYFNKCAPPTIKQMTNVAMAGVSRTINSNCSPKGIRTFLTHRDCVEKAREPLQGCYSNLVSDVYRIRGASERSKMHTAACCYISKFYECSGTSIKKICRPDSQAYYIQESTKLMDELMELFCPANLRWGTKECTDTTSVLPEAEVPAGDSSILPLVIDMMKQFIETQ